MVCSESVVRAWCERLVERSTPFPSLEECLQAIPTLRHLVDLPPGTRVLLRADLNVPFDAAGDVADDARLVALLDTLRFGLERGWVWILHGHAGTDEHPSLRPVADRLLARMKHRGLQPSAMAFIGDWMNDATGAVTDQAGEVVARLPAGSLAVLENARRYSLERCLWDAAPKAIAALAGRLTRYVTSLREKLAAVHVNEGFAASNRDLSSTLAPLAMSRVALGRHVAAELRRLERVRRAELIVFSGSKMRKLDDLEGALARGRVRTVIAAGALAMPFLKADADLAGRAFELGLAGCKDRAYGESYVPPGRVELAARILKNGRARGIEFVLPVDFRLSDGSTAESIPSDLTQLDVGPATAALHAAKFDEFLLFHRRKLACEAGPAVTFHNGVFGVFERPEFAEGTITFLRQLWRLRDAGVEVYVGGGEGGSALRRYGDVSWVTHCFTAGGTILKALGAEPIPYVKALMMAATRSPA